MTTPEEIGWGELIEEDNPRCLACNGELRPLGLLGSLLHFRCRSCGLDQHGEADLDDMEEVSETSPFEGLDELVEDPDAVEEDLLYEMAREEEQRWDSLDREE